MWILAYGGGYFNPQAAVSASVRELTSGSGDWRVSFRSLASTTIVYLDGSYTSPADAQDALRRLVNGVTLADLTA